jgi:hypothetical protein
MLSQQMALNIGLNASLGNMYTGKEYGRRQENLTTRKFM